LRKTVKNRKAANSEMENKINLKNKNIFRIQGFSNSIDNLLKRKLDEIKSISPGKKFSFKKKKYKKKYKLSTEAYKLLGFLLKKFLFLMGKESSSLIFSNTRSLVNQNDILRCSSLGLFFKSAKEIFWYHRQTKIFLQEKNIISIRKTKKNILKKNQSSFTDLSVMGKVEKSIFEQKKICLNRVSSCRLNYNLFRVIENFKKTKKHVPQ